MAVHVQCNSCGAWAITDNHADPDSAVQCVSPKGQPKGSLEGTCCTSGHTHEEHARYAREGTDSSCRPVTITILGRATGLVQTPAGPMAVGGPGA